MEMIKLKIVFELYRLARLVKSRTMLHNRDLLLEAAILYYLSEKPCTVSQVAKQLYSKISSISEKIINMEKEGLVMKFVDNDQRERLVRLTERGVEKINEIRKQIDAHCISLLESTKMEDLVFFHKLLQKFNRMELE